MVVKPFLPAVWARSPHIQTIFGSLGLRAAGKNEMAVVAREVITDAGNGSRLLGYHSRQPVRSPRGLIILIHGWEGSSDSTYVLSTGRFFFRRGYDIFRLNLRDHGRSHHLNRGLFHGALTDETAQAVGNIARLLPDRPCYLIGFSLGGNFALRIALRQSDSPQFPTSGGPSPSAPLLIPINPRWPSTKVFPFTASIFWPNGRDLSGRNNAVSRSSTVLKRSSITRPAWH